MKDTEQRLNNLLRFILADVKARGDAGGLSDNPRVERLADGSFKIIVFASEEPAQKTTRKSSKKKDGTD